MDTSNWRGQLNPKTRQLNGIEILYKLRSVYQLGDDDELLELQKIAQSLDQKSYAGSTSQSDYLEKIASKMDLLEKARREREREWTNQLPSDARQRIVNKIMDALKSHLPVSGQEALYELWKIAQRFEEKIFAAATSQSDYLRKISLKVLSMETKSQRTLVNNLPSNQVGPSNKPPDAVDVNLRKQSSRSRKRPTWTRDYQMD